jgi:uncharacterized protein YkwD
MGPSVVVGPSSAATWAAALSVGWEHQGLCTGCVSRADGHRRRMDTFKLLIISAVLAIAAVVYASVVPTELPPAFTAAPPSTGTTIPPAPTETIEDLEAALIQAINKDRRNHALDELQPDACLHGAAREWVQHLARGTELVHRSEAGLDLGSEVDRRCPGRWVAVGENLGRGPNVDEIQQAFMASPTHRSNVLAADYTHIGVAITSRPDNPGQLLVVVHFGAPQANKD